MLIKNAASKAVAPWLTTKCTRSELQNFARLVGVPVSGTKAELLHALNGATDSVEQHFGLSPHATKRRPREKEISVVSIDMGIRNLAFAHLTSSLSVDIANGGILGLCEPVLQKWRRISVGRDDFDDFTVAKAEDKSASSTLEEDEVRQISKESFEPIDMAAHAYTCVNYLMNLQPKPTYVLIERQRFRTGGHASVQEWSLRVGVFEGMLYSTLHTLLQENCIMATVQPVLPSQVNRFWLQGGKTSTEETLDQVEKITGKEAKREKIKLVNNMLEGSGMTGAQFTVGQHAQEMVSAFRETCSERKPSSASKNPVKPLKKLDDLADSLLQGLAWIKWQENRLRFALKDDLVPDSNPT